MVAVMSLPVEERRQPHLISYRNYSVGSTPQFWWTCFCGERGTLTSSKEIRTAQAHEHLISFEAAYRKPWGEVRQFADSLPTSNELADRADAQKKI